MLDSVLGARPVEAILSGRARVVLGGQEYFLPDLPNRANREWLASLETHVAASLTELDAAGDNMGPILAALKNAAEPLLDMLVSYDRTGVLPAREVLDDTATPSEIVYAVMGVWQAANPLVELALSGLMDVMRATTTNTTPSAPMSSSSPTTVTRGRRSRKN